VGSLAEVSVYCCLHLQSLHVVPKRRKHSQLPNGTKTQEKDQHQPLTRWKPEIGVWTNSETQSWLWKQANRWSQINFSHERCWKKLAGISPFRPHSACHVLVRERSWSLRSNLCQVTSAFQTKVIISHTQHVHLYPILFIKMQVNICVSYSI
jgi:arylamine N-acetyltransferase